jgi:hypothetical protein
LPGGRGEYAWLRTSDLLKELGSGAEGFAVPKLVAFNLEMQVIEMTIVEPPFLLDFAQSKLDTPEDFPNALNEWWERLAEDFGDRLSVVQNLFYTLISRYGIYYYDLAPRNVNFENYPQN